MLIDCMLRAHEVSWLYVTLIAIVFIIIIITLLWVYIVFFAVSRMVAFIVILIRLL